MKNIKKILYMKCIIFLMIFMALPSYAATLSMRPGKGKLVATGGTTGDDFGNSVSTSADGNAVIIGAYSSNHAQNDSDSKMFAGAGYLYIWDGSRWSEIKFVASDADKGDLFGNSVSISADGATVVIGSRHDSFDKKIHYGSAYVYKKSGNSWVETRLSSSSGDRDDEFGFSVSVSSDGNTVVVGAPEENVGPYSKTLADQGAAYVYKWNGSSWAETKLIASDGAKDDRFGSSVAVSSDGNTVVVGVYASDNRGSIDQGAAYVYKWNGSTWVEIKLVSSDGKGWDRLGNAVAVSSDGVTVALGAYFTDDNGTNSGSAYVYKWTGKSWAEVKLVASDGAAFDTFGSAVSISKDGSTLVVGAPWDDIGGNVDQGSAYVYKWNGSAWIETKLTAPGGNKYDGFGISVSLSSDGSTVVVGAIYDDQETVNEGAVYVYKWNGSAYVPGP